MEIGDLRYLTVSAEAGNFSRAANMLARNASTLSCRIGRLENELGLPLFKRGRSGVRLTSGGKAVLFHVRRALAEIDAIKAAGLQNGPLVSVKFDLAFGCRRSVSRSPDSWRDGGQIIRVGGPSVTIKSHHNVGGLPERMNMKLVDPLRELFKDEVRALGRDLGRADAFVGRHGVECLERGLCCSAPAGTAGSSPRGRRTPAAHSCRS